MICDGKKPIPIFSSLGSEFECLCAGSVRCFVSLLRLILRLGAAKLDAKLGIRGSERFESSDVCGWVVGRLNPARVKIGRGGGTEDEPSKNLVRLLLKFQ